MSDQQASAFDPAAFLAATTTEVNERRPSIPVDNPDSPDGCYLAVIGEITPEKTRSGIIGKGDKLGQPWLQVLVPLKLQLPPAVQALGLSNEFQLTDGVFIDLTPQGQMDNSKGKNRQQKAYRDATRTNNPGQAWSWMMLAGKNVKVKIQHEIYNGAPIEKVSAILPA